MPLSHGEATFKLLFEESTDAMLLLRGDVFIDCNQAAVRMMRCSGKEGVLALHPYDISPERQPDGQLSRDGVRDSIAAAFREGSQRFEWVHRAVDGTEFPLEVLLTPLSHAGEKLLHVVWRDITERKRVEESLREHESNLRSLLENATNFVVYRVAVDASTPYAGRVVMVSPSIKELTGVSDPYRFESWFEKIHPQDRPRAMKANRRAWDMGEPYSQSVRVYHPQRRQWIWVHTASTPVFDTEGRLTHFNGLVIDITAQKQAEEALQEAYRTLELRVEERTCEIERRRRIAEGLREILGILNSSRPLEEILDFIVAQVVPLLGANAGTICQIDTNEQLIRIAATSGMPNEFLTIGPIPLTDTKANRATLNRQPYAVPDFEAALAAYPAGGSRFPPQIQTWIAAVREHFGSYLSVPLVVDENVYGAISIFYRKPREFSDEEIELAVAFSDQTALAIENAGLHQSEHDRRRELQTLLDVAAATSSSLELDEMLSATLDRLMILVGASRACVMLSNDETAEPQPRMIRPEQAIAPEDLTAICRLCSEVMASGEPRFVSPDAERGQIESAALLPLRVRRQTVGALVIVGAQSGTFNKRHLALFESIADQLGVAVENARFYEQAEQAAVAAERGRLARDLHDSVTQSLYSMALFAEAARRLAGTDDHESVEEYLSQLCETSQQALKEMRLLVYELRPSTLEEEGLVGAMRRRLDTVEKRAGVDAQLTVEGQVDLPKEIEVGLYRIAQEALNNSLKHAAATGVTVRIRIEENLLTMEIIDDGRGFDLDAAADAGGIGLSTMQERAGKLNGELKIASSLGEGTQVHVQVKVR